MAESFTVTQAEQQLCPVAFNKYGARSDCAASRCMMWVWVKKPEGAQEESSRGYCGLVRTQL